MSRFDRPAALPLTPLELLYRQLGERWEGEAGQKAQMARAIGFVDDPAELHRQFVTSVEAAGSFDNRGEGFFRRAADRKQLPDPPTGVPAATPEVAALLRSKERWSLDGKHAFRYLDRELRPLRTTGGASYAEPLELGGIPLRAGQTPMLDVLLVDAVDGAPIVGEVKIGGDQNLFYALVQGLMHVAALASPAQRARLVSAYPTSASGLVEEGPIDLYLLSVEPPFAGTRPQLASLANKIAAGLMKGGPPAGVLRRILSLAWQQERGGWIISWKAGS